MSNWKTYKLQEICSKLGSGATPRGGKEAYFKTEEYSLIRSQNVLDFSFSKDGLAFISEEQAKELRNVTIEKDDILLNITGDSVARVCQVPDEILPARVNQHVAIIRGNSSIINQKYLKYYLLEPSFKGFMLGMSSSGATRNALTKAMIENFEIKLPDLNYQTQIAQILTSLDDKIDLNLQMNQTLEAMAQALFKEWFVNFNFPNFDGELENGLPKGWRMGKFEELMEFTNGYAFKSNELLDIYEDDCYFVFKMGNIKKGGGLKYDGTKSFYKKANAQNLKKYILKRGDLLMCMTDMKDNVALLGHTALMNEDDKFIVNQRVGLLRPRNDISIDYPYLYILTNFPEFIVELRSRANRGVQVNLSTSEIKNIQVVIPPKNINTLFDRILKPIFNKIFSNIEQIESLTQTRDTLLPKLMSGKLELRN